MKYNTIVDYQYFSKEKNIELDKNNCPMCAAMNVIGGKWKLILLTRIYLDSPARFGELKRKLKGITQTMLTLQLRELEDAGIIQRKVYAEVPPRVEYTITDFGMTLQPIVNSLCEWGLTYRLNIDNNKTPEENKK